MRHTAAHLAAYRRLFCIIPPSPARHTAVIFASDRQHFCVTPPSQKSLGGFDHSTQWMRYFGSSLATWHKKGPLGLWSFLFHMKRYSLELMAAQMVATVSPVVQRQMPMRRVTALYSARSVISIAPSLEWIVTYSRMAWIEISHSCWNRDSDSRMIELAMKHTLRQAKGKRKANHHEAWRWPDQRHPFENGRCRRLSLLVCAFI